MFKVLDKKSKLNSRLMVDIDDPEKIYLIHKMDLEATLDKNNPQDRAISMTKTEAINFIKILKEKDSAFGGRE